MSASVVVGAQFGDEGKGKIIDFLSDHADVVARFQGGANAGHTVQVGNDLYAFHLLPSGVLRKRTMNGARHRGGADRRDAGPWPCGHEPPH